MEKKVSLFGKMGKKYPALANMSANRFSKLTRKELYLIANTVRDASHFQYTKYFSKFTNMSNEALAASAYKWAQHSL